MLPLLANAIEVTGPTGDNISFSPVAPMLLTALLLSIVMIPVIITLMFFFYKKKLQNTQILAAIEKGLPIEDLLVAASKKEATWLSNISAGYGLLFIAGALIIIYIPAGIYVSNNIPRNALVVIPIVLIGLAITRLMRGYYQKKHPEQQNPPLESELT